MSDEDIIKIYNDMVDLFGAEAIPNPEHYPRSFQYYLKLYQHMKTRNDDSTKNLSEM
jgi:hypothetical protein